MSEKNDQRLRLTVLFLIIAFAIFCIYLSYRLQHIAEPTLDNVQVKVEVISAKEILIETGDSVELIAPAEYKVTWSAPQGANCFAYTSGFRNERSELFREVETIMIATTELSESYGIDCTNSNGELISKHVDVRVYEPYDPNNPGPKD